VSIDVDLPGRKVYAKVWRVQVGRVPIYLMDTDVPANAPEDRELSARLYGGDQQMRISQEIVLGIGGVRALRALGIKPVVWHLNEGHAAFLQLERMREYVQDEGLSFEAALWAARGDSLFTTHTPVPAGIDIFPADLVETYFRHYYPTLGLTRDQFLALGRENPRDTSQGFNMAVLAIRLASLVNGVSQLHGAVARKMWQSIWPDVPADEIPIEAITNGIHARSWISHDMAGLFDRYLGPRWIAEPANQSVWERVERIPDEELWRTHERRRERLVAFARQRLRIQLERRGVSPGEVSQAAEVLDPDALTIGFARRFATYKRATLLFRDAERLARLLNAPERPVQILFAGKAHPRDEQGKALIKEIVHQASREEFRNQIVFVEDYDMNVARYLVEGVDVWLNTPRRPREASGTSGMKAIANGVLNLSILDGWWAEAYTPELGWSIGRGEEYEDLEYQDAVESAALYNVLEKEVVPLFYTRGRDGLPRGWIAKMKASMRTLCAFFNTNRMVREYAESFYLPAVQRFWHLMEQEGAHARALAAWKRRMHQNWSKIRIGEVKADADALKVGDVLHVRAQVYLGDLTAEDVQVELYLGMLDESGGIPQGAPITMEPQEEKDGLYTFAGSIPCLNSGRFGYAVRVLPHHEDQVHPYEPELILWG
jgi:starch phosphorylase